MTSDLPVHEADSVEAVAELQRAHRAQASRIQRAIDRTTAALGRPVGALLMLGVVAVWVGFALREAGTDIAQPAYGWLGLTATLTAVLIAVVILVTQRRADELAELRAQLTLQLAILADKRSAKIISLLEELRRDDPSVADRADPESIEMAKPIDPHKVASALDKRDDAHTAARNADRRV